MLAEENIGKISYVFGWENLSELSKCFITCQYIYVWMVKVQTLANRWTVTKFANVFSCQHFTLYGMVSCMSQKMQIFLLRAGSGNYMHL